MEKLKIEKKKLGLLATSEVYPAPGSNYYYQIF